MSHTRGLRPPRALYLAKLRAPPVKDWFMANLSFSSRGSLWGIVMELMTFHFESLCVVLISRNESSREILNSLIVILILKLRH